MCIGNNTLPGYAMGIILTNLGKINPIAIHKAAKVRLLVIEFFILSPLSISVKLYDIAIWRI